MAPWHRTTSIAKFIYCRLYSFRFWWYFLSLFAKLCTLFTRFPTVLQFSFKNTNLSLLPSPVNWDVFYTITYTWSSVTSFKKYMFSCYWLFWRCRNKILSWIISLNSNKLKTSYWNSLRLKIYSLESCQSLFSCKSIRCNFPLTVNDPSPVCDENIQQSSYCQALCVVDCRILEGSRDTIHR